MLWVLNMLYDAPLQVMNLDYRQTQQFQNTSTTLAAEPATAAALQHDAPGNAEPSGNAATGDPGSPSVIPLSDDKNAALCSSVWRDHYVPLITDLAFLIEHAMSPPQDAAALQCLLVQLAGMLPDMESYLQVGKTAI